MNNKFSTRSLHPLCAHMVMALGIAITPVIGMHAAVAADAPVAAPADTIRPALVKIIQPAQELNKSQNFKDALVKLAETDAVPDKTPYEIYIIETMRGTAAMSLGDFDAASKAFEKVFATGKAPAANQLTIKQLMTEQYYAKKDYPNTILWGKRYVEAGGNEPLIRKRMFAAYYFSEDMTNAAKELDMVIQLEEKAGKKPAEEDVKNLAAIYQQEKNIPAYTAGLTKLATLYPSSQNLMKLIDQVFRNPAYSNTLDLDAYRLQLATDNVSKPDAYREYTELALQDGHAIEAKKIIDLAFSNGMLGTGATATADKALRDKATKRAADEMKALPSDEKAVANNKDGKGFVSVGVNYLAAGQFDKSAELIEKGIAKGGLKNAEAAKLELGLAYLQGGKKDKAIETFKSVKGTDGSADLAKIWLIKLNQPG